MNRNKKKAATRRAGPPARLASLPSMTSLLAAAARDPRFESYPRPIVKEALSALLAERRRVLRGNGKAPTASPAALLSAAAERLADRDRARLQPVINATGIVLHTGLGRAPLARAAVEALVHAAGYCNLEIDLVSGDRGRRGAYIEDLLIRLTACQAAMVVNNNAAATLLVLAGLARGREVIVSRGQLIEIGGSYRLPDVMAASGAVLREVGTTNKTRLSDYENAMSDRTAMLLHVHPSNYRISGFTESPGIGALVELARRHEGPPFAAPLPSRRIVVYDDLGSGALHDDGQWRAAGEPSIVESIRAGADIVSFSGDKLLGGPQAGLILGRQELIDRLRKDPLARAVRVDKLTIAALQATLQLYFDPRRAASEIPTLLALGQPVDALAARADTLAQMLRSALPGHRFQVSQAVTFAGGGSLPAWPLPTVVVRWTTARGDAAQRLRRGTPAVVARVENDALLFDLRTLSDADLAPLVAAMTAVAAAATP